MEILSVMIEWLPRVIVAVILAGGAAALITNSSRSAKEWLLLAVTQTEKALGSGTGQLKLRAVYEAFIKTFPLLSRFIPFDTFSSWVDISLGEMREMIGTNENAKRYMKGDE